MPDTRTTIFLNKQRQLLYFFISSLLFCIIYRLLFFINATAAFQESRSIRFAKLTFGFVSDFITVALLVVFLLLMKLLLGAIAKRYHLGKSVSLFFSAFQFLVYFLLVTACIINQKLVIYLFIGLNYTLFTSYTSHGIYFANLTGFLNTADWCAVVMAFLIYFLLPYTSIVFNKRLFLFFIAPLYFLASLWGAVFCSTFYMIIPNLSFLSQFMNPIANIAITYAESFNPYNHAKAYVSPIQLATVKLIDNTFLQPPTPTIISTKQNAATPPWNIVIFVLESVGENYVVTHANQTIVPMPFLTSLAKQGVWFTNNYSGGNITPLGQFSLLTGLYPNPSPSHFEMQRQFYLPSLATLLPRYDSFFVSNSNELYISGVSHAFKNYDNANTIDPNNKALHFNMFTDEYKSRDVFFQRLNQAKTPFIGVYWSGATHYPYVDYGDKTHLMANVKDPYQRYINNLRLLDNEIKETYTILQNRHELERTIFIVVGDHGELFSQHPPYMMHGRTLYQEEIKVPFLIYAPALLNPQTVATVTSSTDIVPTLLTLLRIPFDKQFQGDSLVNNPQTRKYVFVYSDDDDIAAVDRENQKMEISFSKNTCITYDLINDPEEAHATPCKNEAAQEAILEFRRFQPYMLGWYNKARS